MHRIALTLIILFVICTPAFAGPQVDNAEIASIFSADQADRQKQPIDWKVVALQDAARKNRVLELIKQGKICTANDHFRAAMVFQHGDSLDDIRSAFSLAQIAALLDPSLKQARWLTAASWDRILMRKNVPQWYGTQYHRPSPTASMELYKVDESVVTDEERAALNVPSLQEAKDMLKQINGK